MNSGFSGAKRSRTSNNFSMPAAFELGELETNFGHNAPLCVSRAKKRQIDKNRPVSISTIIKSI
jgi:hypothetical protein